MIIKCSKYDLFQLPATKGQIYFCQDVLALYKDYGVEITSRQRLPALVINTEQERLRRIRPQQGRLYYVVTSNCLWLFDTRWILKEGDARKFNAYGYDANSSVTPLVSKNVAVGSDQGDRIIDNNGLLQDGSVVIRDSERLVRAIERADLHNNEISITSYLDGGLTLYPYGLAASVELRKQFGSLHLGVEQIPGGTDAMPYMQYRGKAEYSGDLYVQGDIYTTRVIDTNKYHLSHSLLANETLHHRVMCLRTVHTPDNIQYTEHNEFLITVTADDSAIIKHIQYTDATNSIVTQSGEMIYDGAIVKGSEVTYNASREVEGVNTVVFRVVTSDPEIIITLTGGSHATVAAVSDNTYSDILEGIPTSTQLTETVCLSKLLQTNPTPDTPQPPNEPELDNSECDCNIIYRSATDSEPDDSSSCNCNVKYTERS